MAGFIINLFMVNPEMTIFHLEESLPGGSVFFELSGQKTNRTSFIKYIIKKPNKAEGRKNGI